MCVVNRGAQSEGRRSARVMVCASLALAVLVAPLVAQAESLNEALASAYATNPNLEAQRAATRATDEGVPQARAGLLPQIYGEAAAGYERETISVDSNIINNLIPGLNFPPNAKLNTRNKPHGYSFTLQQQIFKGLQTINAIREAEANSMASREDLRNTEQTTLLDAVSAYMDVVQNLAIVRLKDNNVRVLSDQLASNERRFKGGELTRTDLAQSRSQRSSAIAGLAAAKAQYQSSRATFEEVVGHSPGPLFMPPSIEPILPESLEAAIEIAMYENPTVGSAFYQEVAAGKSVDQIRGELLPEVSVKLKYNDLYDPFEGIEYDRTAIAGVNVKVPIYQGGLVDSKVRQAKQLQLQRRSQLQQAQAQTRSSVISAWTQLVSARAQLEADQVSVESNRIAVDGVRREEKTGKRTLLDVLNQQQTDLNARVAVVSDQRNVIVAEYTLLQAIGRLNSVYLQLPVSEYRADITDHSERVLIWRTEIKPEQDYYLEEGYVIEGER